LADSVRQEHWGSDICPVNIEHIWENSLKKELRPIRGLAGRGTEAFLFGDLNTIAVDEEKFLSDSHNNRMRFSIAHEIGHYFLHCSIAGTLKFNSVEAWMRFYDGLSDDEYKWLEWQANEFAGRLLVPPPALKSILLQTWEALRNHEDQELIRSPAVKDFIASKINRSFAVSADVIARRIGAEDLWPPDKFGK
jgi:hypothetical protein